MKPVQNRRMRSTLCLVGRRPSGFLVPIRDTRLFGITIARTLSRLWIAMIFAVGVSPSPVRAADIPVNTINNSGPGSFRQGLSTAVSGDRLTFQSNLDGATLVNGPALVFGTSVTLHDDTPITLIDNHAYTLSTPLAIDWGGTLVLNGIVSNGTSPGRLTKDGLGTLILSGVNTFSEGTTITGGTIEALNNASLGTGNLTVMNGVGKQSLKLGNGVTLTNKIELQTSLNVETILGGASTLSGVISGTNATDGLTTTGAGTLTLSGVNTFSGGVIIKEASTLNVLNNASLGTGTLSNEGDLTMNLATGLTIANPISLGKNLTTGVATGTVTLSGPITETGPSQFTKTGAGTLILSGANAYTGGTIISQGTLRGNATSLVGDIFNSGSLIFNQTTTGTYSGKFGGAGSIRKEGTGTLILTGNSDLTGTTTINAGALQVNGTLSGPVVLANSATMLTGTGTVGNVTNSGVVQPGTTSIGTLNVHGNYTQAKGTTEFKFNSTGMTPGVDHDVLNITGKASLGGTLNVQGIGGGTFVPGTQYTIITTAGGLSGQFTEARTNLSMFRVNVTYDPNDVTFQLQQTTSLAVAAVTPNQLHVGTALDNIAVTSRDALYTMIGDLGVLPVDQQRQALNQLSGEMFGNLQNLGLEIGNQFQQRVTSVLVSNVGFLAGERVNPSTDTDVRGQSPPIVNGTRTWVQGYGFGGNFRSDGNAGAFGFGQGGGLYGLEFAYDDLIQVGLVGGNAYGNFSDSFGGGGQVNSYQGGMYWLMNSDFSYLLGSTNLGCNSYYTHRDVSISGANQRLKADFSGNQYGTNLEYGQKHVVGPLRIQPLVGLQYLYLCQQGFDESGGPASLVVNSTRASSLRANIGIRAAFDPLVGPLGTIWTPFTNARFVGEMLDNNRVFNASFNGAPVGGAFSAQGTRIGHYFGMIGEGIEIRISDIWSYFGGAEFTVGERSFIGTGSFGAVAVW